MYAKWLLVVAVALVTCGVYVFGMKVYAHATWREILLLGYRDSSGNISKRTST